MRKKNILTACLLSLFLAAGMAHAGDMEMPCGKGKKGMKGHGGGMEMMKARHEMMNGMMSMMKETMFIVKNLNHKPSPAEREKLAGMIKRMDEMMAQHDEMHEKMRKKMKEHMEMRMEKKEHGNGHD